MSPSCFKKVRLLFLCFFLTQSYHAYSFLNFGKFGNKAFSVKGNTSVCTESFERYEVNFQRFKSITWSVPKDKGYIAALNNCYISDILIQNNIPEDALYYYYGRSGHQEFRFKVDVNINGSEYKAETPVNFTAISGISNLLKNHQITDIKVKWTTKGKASVKATATNVASRTFGRLILSHKNTSDTRPVNIGGADFDNIAILAPTSDIYCNTPTNLILHTLDDLDISWQVFDKGTMTSGNNSTMLEISKFADSGTYNVVAHVYDNCRNYKRLEKQLIVKKHLEIEVLVNGKNASEPSWLCDDENQSVVLSCVPTLSRNQQMKWTLPAGWRIEGLNPSSTTQVNGTNSYTYIGNSLNRIELKRETQQATSGIITLEYEDCFANRVKHISFDFKSKSIYGLNESFTSCETEFEYTLNYGGLYPPYTFEWKSLSDGLEIENQFTDTNNTNRIIATKGGSNRFQIIASDADGCKNVFDREVIVATSRKKSEENEIAGWFSRAIENGNFNTSSNLEHDRASNPNRTYFIDRISNKISFLTFDNDDWTKTETDIESYSSNTNKQIQLVEFQNNWVNKFIFFLDAEQTLNYGLLDGSNGLRRRNTETKKLNHIKTQDGFGSFDVHAYSSELLSIAWKDLDQNLNFQFFDIINNELVPHSDPILVYEKNLGGFASGAISVQNIFKTMNQRLYYFNNRGELFSNSAEDLYNGNIISKTMYKPSDFIDPAKPSYESNIEYTTFGKIYFEHEGDIYFLEITSDSVKSLNKIEITNGVGLKNPSQASGYFSVRPNNTIYYIGQDRNLYQAYTSGTDTLGNLKYNIVKSTAYSSNDNASFQHSPVYLSQAYPYKVIYVNQQNQLSELYYYNAFDYCFPKFIKSEHIENVEKVAPKTDFVAIATNIPRQKETPEVQVYPNPATDKLFISRIEETSDLNYEIFDMLGKKVASGKYQTMGIDLKSLISSVYFLKLSSGNIHYKEVKFVVSK